MGESLVQRVRNKHLEKFLDSGCDTFLSIDSDIEIEAKEILRLKTRLNDILSSHTGQPGETIEQDTDRNFYMDAHAAVEYGLVDEVLEAPEKKSDES